MRESKGPRTRRRGRSPSVRGKPPAAASALSKGEVEHGNHETAHSRITFLEFFHDSLGLQSAASDHKLRAAEDDVVRQLEVPAQLERVLLYGLFICFDTFLFAFTFLPLRVLRALLLALISPIRMLLGRRLCPSLHFHRTQLYDLLRGTIVAATLVVLLRVNMSRIYHYIRGQAFIKLYVIFNILDICDKLFCSLGQDVMDALYWATRTTPHKHHRVLARFLLALLYTVMHSLLYFTRLVTLNVAINSTNNALLTILVSNNFVELKSSVFKRFAEQNLLQISCSDIVERFELMVFLVLTGVQHSVSWSRFLESAGYIILCELLVDWPPFLSRSYENFKEILSRDLAPPRTTDSAELFDPTKAISRRVGLSTLPLACVVFRMGWVNAPPFPPGSLGHRGALFMLAFLCALALKTLLNVLLTAYACAHLLGCEEGCVLETSAPGSSTRSKSRTRRRSRTPTEQREHRAHVESLRSIQRYSLFRSRIPT